MRQFCWGLSLSDSFYSRRGHLYKIKVHVYDSIKYLHVSDIRQISSLGFNLTYLEIKDILGCMQCLYVRLFVNQGCWISYPHSSPCWWSQYLRGTMTLTVHVIPLGVVWGCDDMYHYYNHFMLLLFYWDILRHTIVIKVMCINTPVLIDLYFSCFPRFNYYHLLKLYEQVWRSVLNLVRQQNILIIHRKNHR